jgi:hypothetical protein
MTVTLEPAGMDPLRVHWEHLRHLPMWVIYDRPLDYPAGFVARLHTTLPRPRVTAFCIKGPTRAAVEALLPPGLTLLNRFEADDPAILGTWL